VFRENGVASTAVWADTPHYEREQALRDLNDGKINSLFDNAFLENLTKCDYAKLTAYSHEEIRKEAGSGGHEIRTWIALAGAVQGWKAELLAYEPVVPWATGCGLVEFHQ